MVTGISLDSRRLKSGDLFFALATDLEIRAEHIKQAATAEIAAVCYSAEAPLNSDLKKYLQQRQIEMVAVDDLKEQIARLAAAFYQYPSATMTVIAVTGTNGKTSVTQFIAQALENARSTLWCDRNIGQWKNNGNKRSWHDNAGFRSVTSNACRNA